MGDTTWYAQNRRARARAAVPFPDRPIVEGVLAPSQRPVAVAERVRDYLLDQPGILHVSAEIDNEFLGFDNWQTNFWVYFEAPPVNPNAQHTNAWVYDEGVQGRYGDIVDTFNAAVGASSSVGYEANESRLTRMLVADATNNIYMARLNITKPMTAREQAARRAGEIPDFPSPIDTESNRLITGAFIFGQGEANPYPTAMVS